MPRNFFGLDLGSHTLKAVQLKPTDKGKALVAYGSVPTPPNALQSDSPLDEEALVGAVRTLVHDAGFSTSEAIIALPESQVFTRVISVPRMSEKELASAIRFEAEQYVPIPLDEVQMDWQVLSHKEPTSQGSTPQMEVLLVAAPLNLIDRYLRLLRSAQLHPVALETEMTASVRSLVGEYPGQPTTLVICLGAATTDLTVVKDGEIHFTRSIGTGGTALARSIATELGFEMDQAEEYKKSYGLVETELEGKIMEAIRPVFDVIVAEIKRAVAFYTSRDPNNLIKRAVLCGGTASLPGIVVYLAATLGFEVQLGNPWSGIVIPPQFNRGELETIGPHFSVAVGLALKDL